MATKGQTAGSRPGPQGARGRGGGIQGGPSGKPEMAGGGLLVSTTLPDEIKRHDISDEDLDVLCDASRDELWEGKWAALGAFLGTMPSAVQTLFNYFGSESGTLSIIGLAEVLIALVSLSVWLVLRLVVQRKTSTSNRKRDEIRARTRRLEERTDGTR